MRCPQCMKQWSGRVCNECGYEAATANRLAGSQAAGILLVNRYLLGNALASSRQAIGYIAWDTVDDRVVLMEEFYPKSTAVRNPGGQVSSRGNQGMFRKAVEMFAHRGLTTDKPIQASDTFASGGTAWRVYHPNPAQDQTPVMEDILDHPVLFRDEKQNVLMTINALPMPALPQKRAFLPTERIVKQRRNRTLKRVLAGTAIVLLLLAGGAYMLVRGREVPVTLHIPLFQGQRVFTWQAGDQPREITQQLIPQGEAHPDTAQSAAYVMHLFQTQQKPGTYHVSQTSQDGLQTQETELTVKMLTPYATTLPVVSPLPRLKLGDNTKDNDQLAPVLLRLQDLGYLDFSAINGKDDLAPAVLDDVAWQAYVTFAQNNGIIIAEGQTGIYQADMDALLAKDAVGQPYLRTETKVADDNRAGLILKRLHELFYLLDQPAVFDQDAFAAYQVFSSQAGLATPRVGEVSVQGAKALLLPTAQRKTPDIILGEKSTLATQVLSKLAEQGYLGQEALKNGSFDQDALNAYIKFATDQQAKMRQPILTGKDLYLPDIQVLFEAKAPPSPSPNPVRTGGFILQVANDMPQLVSPDGKTSPLDGTPDNLSSFVLELDAKYSYAIKEVQLRVDEPNGAVVNLPLGREKRLTLALTGDKAYRLAFVAEKEKDKQAAQSFESLSGAFVAKEIQGSTYKPMADEQAIEDYFYYGALPVKQGTQAIVFGTKIHFFPPVSKDQEMALQQVYGKRQRVQITTDTGKASQALQFFPFRAADSPLLEVFGKDSPVKDSFSFNLSPLSEQIRYQSLLSLRLSKGQYSLSLFWVDKPADYMMPPVNIEVNEKGFEPVDLALVPRQLRDALKVSAYALNDQHGLATSKNWPFTQQLASALLATQAELGPVDVLASLPEMSSKLPPANLQVRDNFGNIIVVPSAKSKLLLQRGDYQLISGTHESNPLTVRPGQTKMAFVFSQQAIKEMEATAMAKLKPGMMYTVGADPATVTILSDLVKPENIDQSTAKQIFEGNQENYQNMNLQFVQKDWQDDCPVKTVQISFKGAGDGLALLQLPLKEATGNRLQTELFVNPDIPSKIHLQFTLPDTGGTDEVPFELLGIFQQASAETDGATQYISYAIIDFSTVTKEKLEVPKEGGNYQFYLNKDDKDPIGSLKLPGKTPADTGGIWVLLGEGEVWLETSGQFIGSFKVDKDGSTTYTKLAKPESILTEALPSQAPASEAQPEDTAKPIVATTAAPVSLPDASEVKNKETLERFVNNLPKLIDISTSNWKGISPTDLIASIEDLQFREEALLEQEVELATKLKKFLLDLKDIQNNKSSLHTAAPFSRRRA